MTISSRRQSRPLSSTSSSSSSDPSSSSSSTRPSLSLTVCTTLLTLTLLTPCSTPVFASPTPSPGLTPGSGLGLGSSSAPGSGSGSGSGLGFLTPSWSTSSSSSTSTSTAGSTSVSPASSPSLQTTFGSIPVDEVELEDRVKLVGLGYGSALALISTPSTSSSKLDAGSDIHVDIDVGVLQPEPVNSIPQDETEEDSENNQSSPSTWLKGLRSYFSLSARSARSLTPTLVMEDDVLRDSSRPDQARDLGVGSGKTGRRREGDEQDIAGLGKRRRGKFWSRSEGQEGGQAEAGSDPGVPDGSGTVETITAAEINTTDTNSNTTTTTGYLSTSLPTAPTTALPLANSFPLPLDSTLSYSLTNSCVAFLTEFLTSEQMAGSGVKGNGGGVCKPFGLLLGSSSGWADLIRQPDQLNPALSQICHPSSTADSDECSAFFGSMAMEMVKPGNCRQELQQGNTVALSVYRGFQFYDMMQQAACLQDQGTGAYCYLEAMSADRPDDAYLWSIPGGNTLPSTTKPTCSACSKSLLDLYATAPSIKTSSDIPKSAYGLSFGDTVADVLLLVTDRCGAGFLDVKLASAATSGATGKLGVGLGSLALGVVVSLIATMAMSV